MCYSLWCNAPPTMLPAKGKAVLDRRVPVNMMMINYNQGTPYGPPQFEERNENERRWRRQTNRQTHWLRGCTALLRLITSETRHKNPHNLGICISTL